MSDDLPRGYQRAATRDARIAAGDTRRWIDTGDAARHVPGWAELEITCCGRTLAEFGFKPGTETHPRDLLIVLRMGAPPLGVLTDAARRPVEVIATQREFPVGGKLGMRCPTCGSDTPIGHALALRILTGLWGRHEAGDAPARLSLDVRQLNPTR